jgi:trimeric autotransporter adhesin
MNKLAFLPISLMLLNLAFADDDEADSMFPEIKIIATTETQTELKGIKKSNQIESRRSPSHKKNNSLKKIVPKTPASKKLNALGQGEQLLQKEKAPLDVQSEDAIALSQKQQELTEKEKQLAEREKWLDEKERQLAFREEELKGQKTQRALKYRKEDSVIPDDHLFADAGAGPVLTVKTNKTPPQPRPVECHSPFHTMHVGVRHIEANGIGYGTGYTTLEGFAIFDRNPSFMPFVDLRGHVFDDGKLAGNVGIGGRTILSSINHVLGGYLYYDVRQDRRHLTVNQLGPGIELLGERMEYRVNGYFPVGDNKSYKYGFKFDEFKGNDIFIKAKQRRAFTGFDAELGGHITQSTKYDLYAGAGPYYFTTHYASSWGGKLRLLGRYKEFISLEFSYSYDHLFRNIVQGTVAVNLPFGRKLKREGKTCSKQNDLLLSRAAFSPNRFEIPVVKSVSRQEKAINPATGNPWKVWFVDNTSSSDGTFESPFSTLLAAQNASGPNDMIYVFPGDGTPAGMDMGIMLKDGQTLFGSGISHQIGTTKGKLTLPALSNTYPMITNTSGNVVVLGNGNEVSGMNISATGSSAISGNSINGATIANNFISSNHTGVNVIGFGKINITNNQCISSTLFVLEPGITVQPINATFMMANISDNVVSGFSTCIDFGATSDPTTATADATISANTLSNFSHNGILFFTGMQNSIVRIVENTIINNSGTFAFGGIALSVNLAPSSGYVLIDNNQVITTTSSASTNGILAQINLATGAHLNVDITNNRVVTGSGAGSVGINLNTEPNGTICATIIDNQVIQQTASSTNDFNISTVGNGIINIDNFSGNVGPNVNVIGNVNFVPPGTCAP